MINGIKFEKLELKKFDLLKNGHDFCSVEKNDSDFWDMLQGVLVQSLLEENVYASGKIKKKLEFYKRITQLFVVQKHTILLETEDEKYYKIIL